MKKRRQNEEQTEITAVTPHPAEGVGAPHADVNERASAQRLRWTIFPNALDFIVMVVLILLSNTAATLLCFALHPSIGSFVQADTADDAISIMGNDVSSIMLLIIYLVSMTAGTGGILLYRRLRGCRGTVARFSAAGLNPALLLCGFVWLISTDIVIEPLLALLPPISTTIGRGFPAIIMTTVLAPFLEEFLCRGIVLESARAKYGTVPAWILSSVFFALIHLHVTAVVNALAVGSILGYLCIRSRSLFASIILHAINNVLAMAFILFGLESATLQEIINNNYIYTGIYAAAVAVCLAGGGVIASDFCRKGRRRGKDENSAAAMQ